VTSDASHSTSQQEASADLSTQSNSPSKLSTTKVSSVSKKRHTSKFEASAKKLVEEEGISFRTMHSQLKDDPGIDEFVSTNLTEYSKAALDIHTEGPDVLVIPKEDDKWYENSQDPPIRDITTLGIKNNTAKHGLVPLPTVTKEKVQSKPMKKEAFVNRKVHFSNESLILSAALEGELEVVKECVQKVS